MLRSSLSVLVVAFALQTAQAQVHGVPSSVTSPTNNANGQVVLHGVPSSVTSPAPSPITSDQVRFRGIVRQRVPFRSPHGRPHKFVPVPVFYPVYDYPADYAAPPVEQSTAPEAESPAPSDDALQQAYNQGAHDAINDLKSDPRYGSHYLDSREKRQPSASQPEPKPAPVATADSGTEQRDDSPATVFIFKDGHKIETHSYAIVGQTLFDFSSKPLRKLQIADLDVDATRKANDDLGVSLTLP